jgi:hypothetical protein
MHISITRWVRRREQQAGTANTTRRVPDLAVRAASAVFAFHPANGGWRSPVEGAILKAMGVRAGVPDIVAVKGGQCYALELKAPDGRLTPAQRDTHAALAAAGAEVEVAYGLDDALARLECCVARAKDVALRRPNAGPEMAAGAVFEPLCGLLPLALPYGPLGRGHRA